MNPFSDTHTPPETREREAALIKKATDGNRAALEELVRMHQGWIYNTAIRMVFTPEVAEDITQDVLLKVITRLSSFRGESRFRTWLYRILVNHVLDMKKTGSENLVVSLSNYGHLLDELSDQDPPDPRGLPVDVNLIYHETKIACLTGLLVCLDRSHRLCFILGSIWGASDTVGAEILEISPANFRKRLSRARQRLASFLSDRCGLVNENNPCHCRNKAQTLMDKGYIEPDALLFTDESLRKVRDIARERQEKISDFNEEKTAALYADTPFLSPPEFAAQLRELVESPQWREYYDLN